MEKAMGFEDGVKLVPSLKGLVNDGARKRCDIRKPSSPRDYRARSALTG